MACVLEDFRFFCEVTFHSFVILSLFNCIFSLQTTFWHTVACDEVSICIGSSFAAKWMLFLGSL